MIPERPEQEPGEWQQEPGRFGKRYRMVGGVKEYEMEINGVPESVFFASQKAQKERDEAKYKEDLQNILISKRCNCPFSDSSQNNCKREKCALFIIDSCILAQIGDRPATDTTGKQCPLSRESHQCNADCALYNGGCTLTGIAIKKGEKHEQI